MLNIFNFFANTLNNAETAQNTEAGIAILMVLFFGFIFALIITCAVFWIIALVHLIQNEDVKDRTLWLVLLFVINGIIGPVYYFAVKKPYDRDKLKKAKN